MSIQEAFYLGIIQGLTEFLPISSSGHLVFFQRLMGMEEPMLAFDVLVHLGTLVAVCVYFRWDVFTIARDGLQGTLSLAKRRPWTQIMKETPQFLVGLYLMISLVPAVAVGVFFKDSIEVLFHSVLTVAIAWIATGVLLLLSRHWQLGSNELRDMKPHSAFLIGCAQAVALIPGVSRSGSTILAGMALGFERIAAARFSFLMAIPAILGAVVFQLRDQLDLLGTNPWPLAVGFFTAGIVGYSAIALLIRLVAHSRFYLFGYYCFFMGLVALAYHYMAG